MGRLFAYCRVSTSEQTTENQVLEIKARGYDIEPQRIVEEEIGGSTPAASRPLFSTLVSHKMEPGDTLVVLKIDRLGRDNIDVLSTLKRLRDAGIKVISLDLASMDLNSPEGQLIVGVMSAYASFERNRLIERTNEGLSRAKAQGKKLGRKFGSKHAKEIQQYKAGGYSQSQTAKALGIGLSTVKRHWRETK